MMIQNISIEKRTRKRSSIFFSQMTPEFISEKIMPVIERLGRKYSGNGSAKACEQYLASLKTSQIYYWRAGVFLVQRVERAGNAFCRNLEKRLAQAEARFAINKKAGANPRFSLEDLKWYVMDAKDMTEYDGCLYN
jgi:hypothetical protein